MKSKRVIRAIRPGSRSESRDLSSCARSPARMLVASFRSGARELPPSQAFRFALRVPPRSLSISHHALIARRILSWGAAPFAPFAKSARLAFMTWLRASFAFGCAVTPAQARCMRPCRRGSAFCCFWFCAVLFVVRRSRGAAAPLVAADFSPPCPAVVSLIKASRAR